MSYTEGLGYSPMTDRSCFVYGCFSTAANKPNLGFHKFPVRGKRNIVVNKKNGDKCIYDRRQLWIEALNIGREAAQAIDGVNVYVCSLHFARDDFYYNQDITGKRYLKEFAIPRRNLPARFTSPLTTKFNVKSLNRLKYRGHFALHNPDGRRLTAPRRFLGASILKDVPLRPSYTRTVWVVRKPPANSKTEADKEDGNGKDSEENYCNGDVTVTKAFSLAAQSEEATDEEAEVDEDDQCAIVNAESSQQNSWFTSELIIKEEPMSDSEQDVIERHKMQDSEKTSYEAANDDEDDTIHEPKKLVIYSDEEEEQQQEQELKQVGESTSENDQVDEELQQVDEDHDFLPTEADEELLPTEEELFQQAEYEGFGEEEEHEDHNQFNEETNGIGTYEEGYSQENYDVTVVHVSDEEEEEEPQGVYYNDGMCEVCGSDECEGHHNVYPHNNYFVCLVCSEMFPSQKQLVAHSICHQEMSEEELLLHEERLKSLTCEFCGRVLSTKATLREHIMIHTGEKPHQCLLCGKSFRHKANLVVHVNGHAVVSTYKCKKCNKAFTKKMDFEKHLKYHVDASGNPLVCKICNAVFKSQRTLYNHGQLHSRKGMVRAKKRNEAPREPTHVCRICNKVLSTKATLKEHMMIHSGEKPHVCNICGRTIRHKANFVVHVQTHGQGKSYECDMCDEAFMRKSDLTQHKQINHSKSKLLRCPICGEVFKSPQKFNRHMEIHESVVYMNETEDMSGFQPHLLEGFFEEM
ncbi:zinc finger protein 37-like isoform X2 [Homalodisca vitripennis]|uniref:zinc finger protein 37-like isoform X2 n=1 Tax=Homalodisca vitripennis TaxID=197043 RepID=UPI001EEC11FC|nr:zinc finger protein 37-like isoform X2 [Homalodisca vitripennis]